MHDKELLQNSREFSEGAVAPFCFIQIKEYTGLGRIQRSVQKNDTGTVNAGIAR